MPPRVRRTSSLARRGSGRRKLVWATKTDDFLLTGTYNADLLADLRGPGVSVLGCTVIRTHVRFQYIWSSTGTPSSSGPTTGLLVENLLEVTAQAVTVQDSGQDWAYLSKHFPGTGNRNMIGATGLPGAVEGFELDLRSKRKVQELGQTWAIVMAVTAPAPSVNVRYYARTLIALP